jgi:hypothetical protein
MSHDNLSTRGAAMIDRQLTDCPQRSRRERQIAAAQRLNEPARALELFGGLPPAAMRRIISVQKPASG